MFLNNNIRNSSFGIKKKKCTKQRLRKIYKSFYMKHIAIKFIMQKN